MKAFILAFTVLFASCIKGDEIINPRATGQFYFWNPYPISDLGTGIDIYVDGQHLIHYKAQGITNGFFVQKIAGAHSWSYSVNDAEFNYSSSGKSLIEANKNDTIKMVK